MFDNLLNDALQKYGVKRVGVELGDALRSSEKSVVDTVVLRVITKHAHPETAKDLMLVMKRHPDALASIREVEVSIVNSFHLIAGNRLAKMASLILANRLEPYGIGCVTCRPSRHRVSRNLAVRKPTSEQDLNLALVE